MTTETISTALVVELLEALRDATDWRRARDLGDARAAANQRSDIYVEGDRAKGDQAGGVHSLVKAYAGTAGLSEARVRDLAALLRENADAERAELDKLTVDNEAKRSERLTADLDALAAEQDGEAV